MFEKMKIPFFSSVPMQEKCLKNRKFRFFERPYVRKNQLFLHKKAVQKNPKSSFFEPSYVRKKQFTKKSRKSSFSSVPM